MLYFVAEGTLSSKCPLRHAFIKAVVDKWSAGQKDDKSKDGAATPPPAKGGGCG